MTERYDIQIAKQLMDSTRIYHHAQWINDSISNFDLCDAFWTETLLMFEHVQWLFEANLPFTVSFAVEEFQNAMGWRECMSKPSVFMQALGAEEQISATLAQRTCSIVFSRKEDAALFKLFWHDSIAGRQAAK